MAKIQIQDLEPQSFISEVDANELENVQGGFFWILAAVAAFGVYNWATLKK